MKKGTHKINKKTFSSMKEAQHTMRNAKVKNKDIAIILGMSAPTLNKLAKSDTYADYKAIGEDKRDPVKRDSDDVKTKQEQKNEAWVEYLAIVDPAMKTCNAIVNPARDAYQARIKEIDAQDEHGEAVEKIRAQERERVRGLKEKYQQLIMAVETKYEGETSHETALKYIKRAENNDYGVAGNASLDKPLKVNKDNT